LDKLYKKILEDLKDKEDKRSPVSVSKKIMLNEKGVNG
jgi:ribosomal protein L18E